MEFSISAEKDEIRTMIAELENAVQNPLLYYPDFLQEEFAEMKDSIVDVCNELKAHC